MAVVIIPNLGTVPLIDAISPTDYLLIGDQSDGGELKRVLIESLPDSSIGKLAIANYSFNTLPDKPTTFPPTVDLSYIKQSEIPITRSNGSVLMLADVWKDLTNDMEWKWNGVCWRSRLQALQINAPHSSSHNALPKAPFFTTHIYIENFSIAQQSNNAVANDASNYKNIILRIREKFGFLIESSVAVIQNFPLPVGEANRWDVAVNTAYLLSTYSGLLCREGAGVGTDSAYGHYVPIISYRWQIT